MVRVLVAVGMPGSGKSLARECASEMGIKNLSTGDLVREECGKRGLEPTGPNCKMISDELRGIDPSELTNRLIKKVLEEMSEENMVVLEGMRSWEEILSLREHFHAEVLAFILPMRDRDERRGSRGRPEDDPALFRERDWSEIEYGTSVPIAMADHYVLNTGTLDESKARVREILERMMAGSE